MILPHQTEAPRTAGSSRRGLPMGAPSYVYNGSGHDEIQPEECCAECMRVVRRLKEAQKAREARRGRG